jgi:hypothetical protein
VPASRSRPTQGGAAPRALGLLTLGRLRLSVADARGLAEGALRGIGYHNDEARIIADHVIDAAICGYEYSGLPKILNVFESEHFRLPRRSMKVLRETEAQCVLRPNRTRRASAPRRW